MRDNISLETLGIEFEFERFLVREMKEIRLY